MARKKFPPRVRYKPKHRIKMPLNLTRAQYWALYLNRKRRLREEDLSIYAQWLLYSDLGYGQAVDNTWVTLDRIGTDNTRLPEQGRCYLGDGVAYIAVTGLLTTDTIETPSYSDDPTCTIDGRLDIANTEKVGAITIKRAGVTWAYYKCDEQSGADCFDSSGNGNDGTITGATLANFHAIDNTFYSFQNFVGYTLFGAVYVPRNESDITKDVQGNSLGFSGEVKRNGKIVNSNIPNFDGINDYINCNAKNIPTGDITISCCINADTLGGSNNGRILDDGKVLLFIASGDLLRFYSDAGVSLTQCDNVPLNTYLHILITRTSLGVTNFYINDVQRGSANQDSGTPSTGTTNTVIGNRLAADRAFDGNISNVKIYNRILSESERTQDFQGESLSGLVAHYKISEGGGSIAYEVVNGNHGTITNAVLANFWTLDTTGLFRPSNILDGFEYYDDDATHLNIIRVPYDNDGSKITPTISGYSKISENDASYYHNNAESDIQQYKTPQMFINDSDNFFFDLSGNANDISYADIVAQVADNIFADVDNVNAKSDLRTKEIVSNYWNDTGVWDDTGFGVT